MPTAEVPADDVEFASYDGVMASETRKAGGGTVSRMLLALLAGDERCIKRRHKYGDKCGIDLPSCSFHCTSNSCSVSFHDEPQELAAKSPSRHCSSWHTVEPEEFEESETCAAPWGPGPLILMLRTALLRTVEGGSPRLRGDPPMRDSHDQEVTVWELLPATL